MLPRHRSRSLSYRRFGSARERISIFRVGTKIPKQVLAPIDCSMRGRCCPIVISRAVLPEPEFSRDFDIPILNGAGSTPYIRRTFRRTSEYLPAPKKGRGATRLRPQGA